MFTGIVKEIGRVNRISGLGGTYIISVESSNIISEIKIGDSVSVNGACLTLTAKNRNIMDFDVMGETFKRTAISKLKIGDGVNLEGAIKAGEPMGGHFVTGHIDCIGKIKDIKHTADNHAIEINFPSEYKKLVVEKGSIALDGISLTIGAVNNSSVIVYIIPHTLKSTTLGSKRPGDELNIEFDIIGKYVLNFSR